MAGIWKSLRDNDDGRGDAEEGDAGGEHGGELVEAGEADQGEGGGDDGDHAGELHEDVEELIEVIVGGGLDDGDGGVEAGGRAGAFLDLDQLVEVEDHVERDVEADQDEERDQVVLEEGRDDVAVEDFHCLVASC
jgi:hypothetical protein